jgi:hypothetical protein
MDATDELAESELFQEIKFYSQSLRKVLNKIVIQEILSRLYLSEGDFWTPDIETARPFDSRAAALEQITHLKLQNVQFVSNNKLKE